MKRSIPLIVWSIGLFALVMPEAWGVQYTGYEPPVSISMSKDRMASSWAGKIGYFQRAGGKLIFGAKNMLLGCTELFRTPVMARREGHGVLRSAELGVRNAVVDTLGGTAQVLTFPLTFLDFPLPDGGVWQH